MHIEREATLGDRTHYQVLGVPPTAEKAEIRRAYVALARRHHPDFYAQHPTDVRRDAESIMQSVNVAWQVLGHDRDRADYDRRLHLSGQMQAPRPMPSDTRRWRFSARSAGRQRASGPGPAHSTGNGTRSPESAEREEARWPVAGVVIAIILLISGAVMASPPVMLGGIVVAAASAAVAARSMLSAT